MAISKETLWIVFIVTGMLLTGTINTIVKKVQNGWMAPGILGRPHPYTAPWQQSFWMFLGEMLCLIGLFIERHRSRHRRREAASRIALNSDAPAEDDGKDGAKHVFSWLFILPTLCDLGATSLAGIGLLYVPAAAWQMLRGATIVFSGILSVLFLKRKLTLHHWIGMLIVTGGLACVGATVLLPDPSKKASDSGVQSMFGVGLILILAGQVLASIQMVVEELFLKDKKYSAFNVVGMEGLFGTLIMGLFVMPLCYFLPGDNAGSYENIVDAFVQVGQSPGLLILIIAYIFSIALFNFFGLSVSKTLSTIHRTLIDACRTIFVWVTSIILFYAGTGFGEPWGRWSWLQLIGFAFLITGTTVYNGSFLVIKKFVMKKILKKEIPEEPKEEEQSLVATKSMNGKKYQQLLDVNDEDV